MSERTDAREPTQPTDADDDVQRERASRARAAKLNEFRKQRLVEEVTAATQGKGDNNQEAGLKALKLIMDFLAKAPGPAPNPKYMRTPKYRPFGPTD